MRQIKFRVWHPVKWDDETDEPIAFEMCYDWAFEEYKPINDLLNSLDEPYVLMQYTGLKLDGQEIWEGDIIEFNFGDLTEFDVGNQKEYGVVRFSEDGFWTSSLPGFEEELLSDELKSDAYECKIVGNIHENPELLKQ